MHIYAIMTTTRNTVLPLLARIDWNLVLLVARLIGNTLGV